MIHSRELRNGSFGMYFVYVPDVTLLGIDVYLVCQYIGAMFWLDNDIHFGFGLYRKIQACIRACVHSSSENLKCSKIREARFMQSRSFEEEIRLKLIFPSN